MLYIKSLFHLVCIPDNCEYTIYTHNYELDKEGNLVEDLSRGDVYCYGDLFIETPNRKYVFNRLYAAYDYCAKIISSIEEQKNNPVIFVEMETLNECFNDHHKGSFEVTSNG